MEFYMLAVIFFIVMVSSKEVKKNLTCTEGGSITLPDPMEEHGFLLFGRDIITALANREIMIYDEIYKDKVLWNSSSGLFTITRLQRKDSGIYSVQSKTGRIFVSTYKLTVYESVPTPTVDTLNVSAESCTLLCSVEKAEETTLLWYKDEQIVNQSSSTLSLPLTVLKQDLSFSYRCVAANPADQKTLAADLTTSCSENREHGEHNDTDNISANNAQSWLFLIPIIVFESAVAIYIILTNVKTDRKTETTTAAPSALH